MTTRSALFWSFAERYAGFVLSLGSTVVLARLLTPAQVGVYSLCASLVAVVGVLRDFGVSEYLIQERELTLERIRAAQTVALIVAWLLALLIYGLRRPAAMFFAEPRVAEVLAVMSLQFVILPLTSPVFALLNREMDFRRIFVLQLACNAAHTMVSLGLAWRGFGSLALAWGPIAGVVTQTVLLGWWRGRDCLQRPGLAAARRVLAFGSMYVTSRTLETLARNVHEAVIAKRFDIASVGLYSRAQGLIEMFHSNVADAAVRVATPAFAAEHRAGRPMANAFARATAIFVCVSWTFFGFVACSTREIIAILFGPQWEAAAPLATILVLAALPMGLYELVPQMLSATGHVQRRLRVALVVTPIHVMLVLAASTISLGAVAAASIATSLITLALFAAQLRQALGAPLATLARPCVGSAVVASAAVAVMAAAGALARHGGWPDVAVLAVTLLVGAAGWWLAARALGHPAYHEALRAAARFVGKSAPRAS